MLAQVAGGFGWIPREALAHGHCNPFLYIQMLAVLVSGKQDLRLVDSGKAAWLPLVSTVGRKNAGSNRRMAGSIVRYGTPLGSTGCSSQARSGTMPACCKPSRSVCMQNKPSKAARELHKATKRARKARKQIELDLARWARWQLIRYFVCAFLACLGAFAFCTVLWEWWR